MASIIMNPVPNLGTMSTTVTGNEKLVIIGSDGKPSAIKVNLILNKIDEKIEDTLDKTSLPTVNLSVVDNKLVITNIGLSKKMQIIGGTNGTRIYRRTKFC